MRKILMVFFAALILAIPVGVPWAQESSLKAQKQVLKLRHKQERAALKLRKKYWLESLKGQPLPKSERSRIKHQLQREERDLRQRQKDEQQDFKDRQRLMKEIEKQV